MGAKAVGDVRSREGKRGSARQREGLRESWKCVARGEPTFGSRGRVIRGRWVTLGKCCAAKRIEKVCLLGQCGGAKILQRGEK